MRDSIELFKYNQTSELQNSENETTNSSDINANQTNELPNVNNNNNNSNNISQTPNQSKRSSIPEDAQVSHLIRNFSILREIRKDQQVVMEMRKSQAMVEIEQITDDIRIHREMCLQLVDLEDRSRRVGKKFQ